MRKLFLLLCLVMLPGGCLWNINTDTASAPVALDMAEQAIGRSFADIDSDLKLAAAGCADAGGDTTVMRSVLRRLKDGHPAAVDASFFDARGILQAIVTASARKSPGANLSGNPLVAKMLAEKAPMMSAPFAALDGFQAVALLYPVTKGGVFSGAVTMLLRPESLLRSLIEPRLAGMPVDIWVMDPAGKIIYDPDTEEIGRDIFHDKLYQPFPGLLAAARNIAASPKGSATYTFLDRKFSGSVKKYAYWKTVSLYGAPWRLVLTKAEKEGVNGKKTLEELGIKSLNQAFSHFVALDEMKNAIDRQNRPYLLSLFREFYSNNPGLYSVQWVDEDSVVRFGYPPENSLNNYRFDAERDAAQSVFMQAVRKGKKASIEMPLLEGNIGQLLLCPVKARGIYRGMVYYVRIKP